MKKHPNPQGKGLVPILQGLQCTLPQIQVPAKRMVQIASELFTSLFILRSEITFKPTVGRSYWLYKINKRFKLLMVGPTEWHGAKPGLFVGECVLQNDITWTLQLSAASSMDNELMALLKQASQQLQRDFYAGKKVEDVLPKYEASMSFYGRALAYGLSHSLHTSMVKAGINGLSFEQAMLALQNQHNLNINN